MRGKFEMTVFEELKARGLLAQLTDEEEIKELINAGKATFYIGFDPTADSLHVGHFMALCLMKRLQSKSDRKCLDIHIRIEIILLTHKNMQYFPKIQDVPIL